MDQADNDRGSKLQEIRLHIYDKKNHIRFLIDSGSIVYVLPRSIVRNVDEDNKNCIKLFAANGSVIKTYGNKVLELTLGLRRVFKWPFIIADVQNAIIGADLLAHYGLLIDLKQRCLRDSSTLLTTKGTLESTSMFNVSTVHNELKYAKLLQEFIDITKPPMVPRTDKECEVAHYIVTTGPPVAERCRDIAGEKRITARTEIEFLLENGIIRPSSSPWASPIHMVTKKTGGWRICGDFRKLNAITTPDQYRTPKLEDLFQMLHSKKVFSKLDLVRAYYQIPMCQQDIPKTAVTTPFGLYEFIVMPFGLRNASKTFQRYVDIVFRGLDFVFVYIDDVLIMSDSHQQHEQHLRIVCERLRQHQLTINVNKCIFGQDECEYLGFKINDQGYRPPQDKVQAIIDYPKPETIQELRRFLGMMNYYRRCIPGAAQIQSLLNEYLKSSK